MRKVTSTRGRSSTASGSTSTPVTRPLIAVPGRAAAHQRQRLGDVVAAGAHVGGAPGRERHLPGPVAMAPADSARRSAPPSASPAAQAAGVGTARESTAVEVAARRQHVGPAARGRPAGPGRHEPAVQPAQQAGDLRRPARAPARVAAGLRPRSGPPPSPTSSSSRASSPATSRRASSSSRSTVSPAVRHSSRLMRSSRAGRGPAQGSARSGAERVPVTEPEIARQRPQQRGVEPPSPRPRGARASATSRSVSWLALGRAAEARAGRRGSAAPSARTDDCRAAAAARLAVRLARGRDRERGPSLAARGQDLALEMLQPARIELGRLVVLVDQAPRAPRSSP